MTLKLRERIMKLDPVILAMTAGLIVFGLIALMSATGPIAFQRTGDSLYFVKRQLLFGIFPGLILFAFFAIVEYKRWKPLAGLFLIATFILLLLVYLPGIGFEVGGSRSWAAFGPIRFQPSEFVKLTFLIYLAAWLAERKEKAHDLKEGALPFAGMLGAVVLFLILQPDTGTMAVLAGTSVMLYLASGAPILWFGMLSFSGAGLVALLIKISPYRAARFMTFLHPELDPKGIGYHINQAILAIGSGGFFGLGYGKSRQKFLYLPEVEADSIFAVIAEEMGFVIVLIMLAAFAYLIFRCFKIAKEADDAFGAFLAAGVGAWLGIQLLINVMSMTGLMPMTGVTLPFISHGGTSMVVLMAAMGLIAGIPRHSKKRLRI